MANTVKQVDQSHQLDQTNLETVGGTSSSQFGGQTRQPAAQTLMASGGQMFNTIASAGISYAATTGAELTVASFSLPANTLDIPGRCVVIQAWGSATFASGTCVVKLYFGSVGTTVGTLATTNVWWAQIQIWKSGSSTQSGFFQSSVATTHQGSSILTQTESDTAAIVMKVTANNSAVANAAVVNGFVIEGFN